MLDIKHRLKSSNQIENVFKKGKSTQSGFLFLKYCPNSLSVSRIAFSVGVKFSKKAVDRNKAKRILRNQTRKHLHNIKKGFDIVFFLGNVSPSELKKDSLDKNIKQALISSQLIKQ
ncbi:MAG: ribonuclease P protein component [Patescibacteria group bacterium]|nr:ribonuclease P protein component [Patescibacteria group bacterium]